MSRNIKSTPRKYRSQTPIRRIINREYKDSVFRLVFGEKDKLVELANALFDTDYTLDTPLDINTIEEAIYAVKKNDISFIIDNAYVVISEHQSSINPNMPTRDLMYYAELLKDYLKDRDIYGSTLVKIPRPTFVVLYNGEKPIPNEMEVNLSDAFLGEGKTSLNLTATVYNINKGSGCTLLEKSPTLYQYSQLMQMIRDEMKKGEITHSAIQNIEKICIEKGILVDYMKKYGRKGIEILCHELTEEEALEEKFKHGYDDGYNNGYNNGVERLNKLNLLLKEAGRTDDLFRSMEDPAFQQQLLEEFGLAEKEDK